MPSEGNVTLSVNEPPSSVAAFEVVCTFGLLLPSVGGDGVLGSDVVELDVDEVSLAGTTVEDVESKNCVVITGASDALVISCPGSDVDGI
jgi:hypothetical protein